MLKLCLISGLVNHPHLLSACGQSRFRVLGESPPPQKKKNPPSIQLNESWDKNSEVSVWLSPQSWWLSTNQQQTSINQKADWTHRPGLGWVIIIKPSRVNKGLSGSLETDQWIISTLFCGKNSVVSLILTLLLESCWRQKPSMERPSFWNLNGIKSHLKDKVVFQHRVHLKMWCFYTRGVWRITSTDL